MEVYGSASYCITMSEMRWMSTVRLATVSASSGRLYDRYSTGIEIGEAAVEEGVERDRK